MAVRKRRVRTHIPAPTAPPVAKAPATDEPVAAAPETPKPAPVATAQPTHAVSGYPSPYDNSSPEKPVSTQFADGPRTDYEGSRIPWYVRVGWIGFWFIALGYVVLHFIPDFQRYW